VDDGVVTTIALVTAGILGGIGTWWSRRRLRKAGVGADQGSIVQNLRDVADGWEERYTLEKEGRLAAQEQLAAVRAEQALERSRCAECRSDLDDTRARIRELERELADALGRRRRPRAPRDEPTT
jgi:hypothetical protein